MRVLHITGNRRGRLSAALLAGLVLTAVLIAGTAEAGLFGKKKPEAPKATQNHRFNRFPTLSFRQGTLSHGPAGSWQLDDRTVQLAKGCLVTADGQEDGQLQDGRLAIVAGTVIGDQIFATHIRMLKPDWDQTPAPSAGVERQPSESNPAVGVLGQAPR